MANTYASLVLPQSESRNLPKDILVVLGASWIIALLGALTIYLPFSPVPIATRAQVVLLLAAFLGSKRGSLAVMAYLFQGAIGLPFFAGGASGVLALAGPTGGYLLGYLLAAFTTGYLVEQAKSAGAKGIFTAMAVGNLVIYACGTAWLGQFIGLQKAFLVGVIPFLLGDFFKLLAALKIYKAVR